MLQHIRDDAYPADVLTVDMLKHNLRITRPFNGR